MGLVEASARRVRVTYRASPSASAAKAPTQLIPVSRPTLAQIGAERTVKPFEVYVAFLPPGVGDVLGNRHASARAFAANGSLLGKTPISWAKVHSDGQTEFLPCNAPPTRAGCREIEHPSPVAGGLRPLPGGLGRALAAHGIDLAPAGDADRRAARFDPREAVLEAIRQHADRTRGLDAVYLARLATPHRPVYVVELLVTGRIPGGSAYTERHSLAGKSSHALYQWDVVVDARSGRQIAAVRRPTG